jgi:hypothetical protein
MTTTTTTTTTTSTATTTRRLWAAGLAVFVAVFTLHALCIPAQGLTDDDDFYAPAGIRYAEWLGAAATSPSTAFARDAIDAAFVHNHEHPPFAKVVFGVAHSVFHDGLGVAGHLDAARMGNALLVALGCAVLFVGLWRARGLGHAAIATATLVSLPRFFFHSEVATLDVPVAMMITLACAAFLWADDRVGRGLVAGVVFGLALLTKLNAPFAALACVALVLLERWRGFAVVDGDSADNAVDAPSMRVPSLTLPAIPPSLFFMAIVGPALFVLLWPWLWHDTGARLGGYFAFHLRHYPIFLFFDGEIWNEPFAPGRAAVVMAFATVPAVVAVTGLFGAVSATVSLKRLAQNSVAFGHALPVGERVLVLALLQATLSLGVVALANVPRYGGEKLFMPFFPFFCVLVAEGVSVVARAVVVCAGVLGAAVRGGVAVAVVAVVVVGSGVVGVVDTWGGFALSYYGGAVGGLRGAVARGHERTYYDVADKELARQLSTWATGRKQAGQTAKVHFVPNHKEYARTYRWLKKDGVVDNALVLVDNAAGADVVVVTHERRWSTYPALWAKYRDRPVLFEKRIDGVPLWTAVALR